VSDSPWQNVNLPLVIEEPRATLYELFGAALEAPIGPDLATSGFDWKPVITQYAQMFHTDTMYLPNVLARWQDLLAVFTLERDEDGDMIFADTVGAMYGIGPDFCTAVEDWIISARERLTRLHRHSGNLLEDVSEQLGLFDRVLAERPAIAES
jgi:hypothetical protein